MDLRIAGNYAAYGRGLVMARKTLKYTTACETLGIPPDADLPHEAVYGLLSIRGYLWDGARWTLGKSDTIARGGALRVSAVGGDAELITLALIDILPLIGLEPTTIKGPYPDRKSDKERFYLSFVYKK